MSNSQTTGKTDVRLPANLRCLCVDDDPEIVEIVVSHLESLNFTVLKAYSGEEALTIIKQEAHRLALVMSDYKMTGMSGFELRQAMLSDYREIPFISLSGCITTEMALSAIELKVSAFLDKPFDSNTFRDVVQRETKDRIASILEEQELLTGFILEAESLLDEMEGLVLGLEETVQAEAINRIFACAHTIKGASGFFKPDTVYRFTHKYEDYLSRYKTHPDLIDADTISTLLKGVDTIKKLIAALLSSKWDGINLPELLEIFEARKNNQASNLGDKLPDGAVKKADSPTAKKVESPKNEELRVSVTLLDGFMERSGEMTVLRNMMNKVLRAIEIDVPGNKNVGTLSDLFREMHKINSHMQDQIFDLRKVPVKQVLKPLARTLRDLSVSLKKEIELKLIGQEIRIDHSLADLLSKSLIHLLRNSADHGIESAQQRQALGKVKKGTIIIETLENQELITLRISDDGRGIDPSIIRVKAIEKGILTGAQAEKLTDKQARMLIFEPGFSTASEITDVSGRGVGTDMVMKSVLSIGGRIEILSEVGQGTQFIIELPIPKSVLIISSLLVRLGAQTYAIPQENITRLIRITDSQDLTSLIKSSEGAYFYQEEFHLLPLVPLLDILKLNGNGATYSATGIRELQIIKVHGKNATFGLLVDEVLGIEDTVIKKLNPSLQSLGIYQGSTFLDDGEVGLILSVDGIAQKMGIGKTPKKEVAEKSFKDSQSKQPEKAEHIILYEIGPANLCGSLSSDIFRLEEFSSTQLRKSGEQAVLIYREKAMPIYNAKDFLDFASKTDESNSSESFPVIVVQLHDHLVGVRVHQIFDLIDVPTTSIHKNADLSGRTLCLLENKTVTLIDLKSFVSEISSKSFHPS